MAIPTVSDKQVEAAYQAAKERYAGFGIDTDKAVQIAAATPVSMHCWQGDDVGGFEVADAGLDGGLMATGNYPGRARTPQELRADMDKAMSLIPGACRANVHALYAETDGKKVDRDALTPAHFAGWMDWAKEKGIGLDFNPSFFSHPKADGMTLANADNAIRSFWIGHGIASREIAAAMGAAQGTPCVMNVWIPDGMKDYPANRYAPRERLTDSLNQIFAKDHDPATLRDAVESKLFGLGSEAYVVGSFEYYIAYAIKHNKLLCLDTGHFHPTETIDDKLSSVLSFLPEALLHLSRPMRWDSDHVVTYTDELLRIFQEIIRGDMLKRVYLATDFFDASINRIAAWTIGMRNVRKALLAALLEPVRMLQDYEANGKGHGVLGLAEEFKSMPLQAVWDYLCLSQNVPVGAAWLNDVEAYETEVLSARG